MIRLGVNVDHIATIREARKGVVPDPVEAALIAEGAGCDGITAHLRQDKRHIKEEDIRKLRKKIKTKLNIELSTTKEIVAFVKEIKPDWVCFVPERVEEITTEGGLDIIKQESILKEIIPQFTEKGIMVTLFVEPEEEIVKKAKELGANAIEINTKSYALSDASDLEVKRIIGSAKLAVSFGLEVHAGHDLNYGNLDSIKQIKEIEEVNIGHSIVSRAVFSGLGKAVKEMVEILK